MRVLLLVSGLLALGATSAVAVQASHDDGCEDGCVEQACADDHGHADGHAEAGDDACGDRPCPCDGDDQGCPPNCHECVCSGIAVSTVAPSAMPSIGCAPEAARLVEPPLERRASGVMSRVFRPPRA